MAILEFEVRGAVCGPGAVGCEGRACGAGLAGRVQLHAFADVAAEPVGLPGQPDNTATAQPGAAGQPGSWDGELWEALRELPDKQRQVVAYHYLAGLPYAEIAAIVGGTADAARRAAADGIKNLRRTYLEGATS